MSKTASKTNANAGRSPLLVWGAMTVLALAALAAASVLIAGGPGGPSSAAVERPVVGGDLHAMAVDPKNPDRVMVGGHEGAAISEDGGKTWEQVPDLEGADPMGWAIDPTDPKKMYAGGHPGFYHSEDGGETWSQDNSGLPATDVHGLGIDPQDPDTLYASIMGAGLYRTTEAGGNWEPVNVEVGAMGPILVDPRDSETLYVAGMEGDFYRSEDGGKSWDEVGTIPGGTATWVSQSLEDSNILYAAGGGVAKSTDGGESWRPMDEGLPKGVSTVAVAPDDKRVVYAGVLDETEALVYRSEDGGGSWEVQNG
ncbi:MAG TPA: YCF48-related protein [Rubrobacter sp.]|nr:YCF48-related protein [Rubrobacter sp.]